MSQSPLKERLLNLLEPGRSGHWSAKAVSYGLVALILLNAGAAMLETMEALEQAYRPWFWTVELVSVGVFSLEYLLRVYSCTGLGYSPFKGRLAYMGKPLLLVDLAAILPFYMAFLGLDLRMVRLLRLGRFIRLAKLGRYSKALRMMGRAISGKKEELLVTLMMGAIALCLAATLIYYAEHQAQPQGFSSIPASFWWAVSTLTTVGYGDVIPQTFWGKLVGGLVQVMGVGLFALPAGLLASGFLEEIQRQRKEAAEREAGQKPAGPARCPHCGKEL